MDGIRVVAGAGKAVGLSVAPGVASNLEIGEEQRHSRLVSKKMGSYTTSGTGEPGKRRADRLFAAELAGGCCRAKRRGLV